MPDPTTVIELIAAGGTNAVSVAAPDQASLSYGALRSQVGQSIDAMNAFGVGRNDRVAIVLPNGPMMATAFLSVAAAATACPLNPAYREDEFAFYLSDLSAKALVVEKGSSSVAVAVARQRGIPVVELTSDDLRAGTFVAGSADAASQPPASSRGPAQSGDVALILHTSGTTSRPKMVPLTHANLCASARNIVATLQLTASDRQLGVMPLFHIHGLVAGLLAPLAAGSSVFCTPGFNALKFFAWMAECRPTWYTAVPTMHQAIVARATQHREVIAANPLRFVRSSSAAIPRQVIAEVEALFGTPLIESYGMTEASHQMASNPLPPRMRKPGTVGQATGCEIGVIDEAGQMLAPGRTGELVVRGPTVLSGYANNPEANAGAFVDGWLRTGDQGVIDADGYVSITGRLKEIINRGGEKISPREVDEILMDHPAVAQAVAFGIPHEKLGEDVGAVIVLRPGHSATERDLRSFAAERLAEFKVPRKVLIVDEIPKGATGKLQRIGLAARLGLSGSNAGRP